MAGTFSRSFQLVKESFAVLKKDKELIWFPVISLIVVVLLSISFVIPVYFLTDIKTGNITNNYLHYVLLFAFYLLSYFIIILAIISSALSGIFVTALYNYANTGKVPSVYIPEIIENAFKPKIPRGII